MMDGLLTYAKDGLSIMTVAGTLVIWVLLARIRQEFPSKQDLKGLVDRHDDAEGRITVLEKEVAVMRAEIRALPSHEDVADLKASMAAVKASMEGLEKIIGTVREQLSILMTNQMGNRQ